MCDESEGIRRFSRSIGINASAGAYDTDNVWAHDAATKPVASKIKPGELFSRLTLRLLLGKREYFFLQSDEALTTHGHFFCEITMHDPVGLLTAECIGFDYI